jgi:hypothetical protein
MASDNERDRSKARWAARHGSARTTVTRMKRDWSRRWAAEEGHTAAGAQRESLGEEQTDAIASERNWTGSVQSHLHVPVCGLGQQGKLPKAFMNKGKVAIEPVGTRMPPLLHPYGCFFCLIIDTNHLP